MQEIARRQSQLASVQAGIPRAQVCNSTSLADEPLATIAFFTLCSVTVPNPQIWRIPFLFLFLLLSFSRAQTQTTSTNPTAGQNSDSSKPSLSVADHSQEPFLYEYLYTKLRYENDGTGSREQLGRARVQSPAGLSMAGQLIFSYNADNESIDIRSVRVIKPDGSIVITGSDNVQDLSAPVAREAPMYTDARQKHVTVAGLAVGDTLEYDIVVTSKPLLAGEFWYTEAVDCNAVCLDRQVELNVPAERPLKLKGPGDAQPVVRNEADRRIYTWKTSTAHVLTVADLMKNYKVSVTSLLEGARLPTPRRILFSTFQSWSDVGAWYAALERDRRVPNAEVRAVADGIVKGKTTDLQKARALYDWVSSNIRYVSLSFGIGRIQPHAASEVLANRYGDCKDKTTLLEAMLNAEGIQGEAAIVNSMFDVDIDVPSPLQFDHVITVVPIIGQNHWLDPTVGVAPFDYLLPQLRGKRALVVSLSKPPAIVEAPQLLPLPTMYHVSLEGTATDDAKLDATLKLQTRGDLETLIRILFTRIPPDQIQTALEPMMKQAHSPAYEFNFSDFKASNVSDTTKPVEAQMHFTGRLEYVDLKSTKPGEFAREITRELSREVLALVPGVESKPDAHNKPEQMAVQLGGPKEYSLDLSISVPTVKSSPEQPPESVHLANDYAEYEATSSWSGQTFHATWRLNLRVPEVPEKNAKEYAEFVQKVAESLEEKRVKLATAPVTVVGSEKSTDSALGVKPSTAASASNVASSLPSSEAVGLLKQGQDEAKRQNWANAIQSFQSALKLDPAYPDAWHELGRAYMSSRNYKDAESAFRKHLEFAPDNRLAYLDMAWVLYIEKKFDEDVQLLEKRVASAPNDADAHTRLGAAYLALHQADKAVPELEKGTSLAPRYEYARYNLAQAYLQAGLNDKAAAAFTKAIELDDSDMTLNNAAYQLAQKACSLDLAENWASKAVQTVELELNGIAPDVSQDRVSALVTKLSLYWDTLGWVKFQQKDYAVAEKYLHATWQLRKDVTPGMHLGRVYEAEGRKDDAIDMYAQAVEAVPPKGVISDEEKEAHERMTALLWNEAKGTGSPAPQPPSKPRSDDSLAIPNPQAKQGIAQFRLVVGPDSKIAEIQMLGSDNSLADFVEPLRSTALPQSFPDETLKKLPRVGTLACAGADQPCKFTLLPAGAAARVVE